MEDTAPDFRPLSESQIILLEELEYSIKEREKEIQGLPPKPDNLSQKEIVAFHERPEFSRLRKLHEEIDNLTVRAIRSLWRRVPGKTGYPRIRMLIEYKKGKNQISYVPGDGIEYHPEMPRWALEHCCLWIHDKRWIRSDEIYNLLAKCKMGFETGLRPPLDFDLLERVLRLRGFDMNSEKDLKKIQKIDGIKNPIEEGTKKRVRKVENSWDQIAFQLGKLAKEGSIPTTGEGLKIMLQKMFPDYDFDKV